LYELELKDKEILSLKELLRKEREIERESELVNHLKKELKARQAENEQLRRDYQRSVESNENLNIEVDTIKAQQRINEQHLRETDRMGTMNENL